jgi:hypothetical protein
VSWSGCHAGSRSRMEGERFTELVQFELSDDGGWGIPEDDPRCKAWIESDSKVSVSYLTSHRGWPKVEGGVEVLIKVCSDFKELEEERPACRLPVSIDCLSVSDLLSLLCHSTVGTSGGSCASFRSRCRVDSVIVSKYYVARGFE